MVKREDPSKALGFGLKIWQVFGLDFDQTG